MFVGSHRAMLRHIQQFSSLRGNIQCRVFNTNLTSLRSLSTSGAEANINQQPLSSSSATAGSESSIKQPSNRAISKATESSILSRSSRRRLRMYAQLGKARLSGLVVASTAAGYLMAGSTCPSAFLAVAAGTSLAALSANTWNQLYEINNDARMNRTRARPLPSQRMKPIEAAVFGAVTGCAGTAILYAGCNPLTATLGAANIILYAAVYTPLKQWSPVNTVVGAVVGAIPPLMGWAAATGGYAGSLTDPEALSIASLLFLWQMPHFYALSWRYKEDYSAGGYKMISLHDTDASKTANRIFGYSAAMAALPFITTFFEATTSMFAVWTFPANVYIVHKAWQFHQDPTDKHARSVFLSSLWYLPLIMALMVVHSRSWRVSADEISDTQEPDIINSDQVQDDRGPLRKLQKRIHHMQQTLRDYCVHEIMKEEQIQEGVKMVRSVDIQQGIEDNKEKTCIEDHVRSKCPIVSLSEASSSVSVASQGSSNASSPDSRHMISDT